VSGKGSRKRTPLKGGRKEPTRRREKEIAQGKNIANKYKATEELRYAGREKTRNRNAYMRVRGADTVKNKAERTQRGSGFIFDVIERAARPR